MSFAAIRTTLMAKYSQTIGYHIVISGYGLWLPGDDRGSWSEAWDEARGFFGPHTLHPADPARLRMAQERSKHPPVMLNQVMTDAVIETLADCQSQSNWNFAAASIESTHSHLLLTRTDRHIDQTIKWIKQCTTRRIHQCTSHQGPVWAKGCWRTFVFNEQTWARTIRYIERHNERRAADPRPYPFLRS